MGFVQNTDRTVFIVDDEVNIRRTLRMVLEGEGYRVNDAGAAEALLDAMKTEIPDLVILDVALPGMRGTDALEKIRALDGEIPVIMISGHASLSDAVAATRLGAFDFFEKPLDRERVLVSVRNALEKRVLKAEVKVLHEKIDARFEMIGESDEIRRVFGEIEKVAPTKGRVLITGESGTGKELIARAIHRLSTRANGPFVKVNCAAIPSELIESELFGHERGSFTGATQRKRGQFEVAHEGTIFLDEIGDMGLSAQAKVLRVLQQGELTRVGSEELVKVDVRVLAATNKDLERAVTGGTFREDLYFRLNVVPIHAPPLRDRTSDIAVLVGSFVREFCEENGFKVKSVDPAVLERLEQYPWPGNVREIKNLIERLVIMSNETIVPSDLPDYIKATPIAAPDVSTFAGQSLKDFKDRMERDYILHTLRDVGWNISRAASVLGIERTNLHKKIRAHNISREGSGGVS
ncbi:MAG: sigma-54-dependent Fis family transcriptional regulator [Deltaproteobacteria bacterium]|nr:sigma-54-dependent Fis family transcriptional regulator [Deltaproteobacteria bacterium]